nr:Protein C48B4.13 [Haemonchus contortus]
MVLTFSSQERRAYIPPELKRRLCELSGKASTCDFNEVQSTPVDDENYSKWSICKHHPELLPCKWDPLKKITIPVIRYEAESFPSPPNFIKAEPDIFAVDLSQATAIMKPLVEPKEALKAKESLVLRGSKVDNRASYTSRNYGPGGPKEIIPPRYDGKLNVENELKINQQRKPIASPETEEFDENILMANDDVFGG